MTATGKLKPPYRGAAAGPFAVLNSFRYALKTSGMKRGLRVFLDVNQQEGFDCPGCAWPDPKGHRATFEFCENGARAVAHEADRRIVDAAFFAAHSISSLRGQSDHQLEHHGRLSEPVVKREGSDHYQPITWPDAYALVAHTLRALPSPNDAVFYTSGRTSNEAAFVYQLLARTLGTNNLPDCSNMCHESSGKGMLSTIGVGKGTVQLDDFEHADCIFVIGQNPGTNHPRMLSTLRAAHARGCAVVAVNPIKERGLESFAHPQKGLGVVGVGSPVASHWARVRINGDVAFLKGVMKVALEKDRRDGGVFDHDFIRDHTSGYDALVADLDATSFDDCVQGSGVSREVIDEIGALYARSKRVIVCWAMGITQHENGVDNVRAIINLLLLGGHIGREGAGACPVRGHSNVQGDRTMGIYEAPSEAFLQGIDRVMPDGKKAPRAHGYDVVHAIEAFEQGKASFFMAMGGNLVAAAPDTARVDAALQKATLTVSVSTKLNRTHLSCGAQSLILPCLGRSDIDMTCDVEKSEENFVTVENSMGVVHRSQGHLEPPSQTLKSEVEIVARIGSALHDDNAHQSYWAAFCHYPHVRDVIAVAIPGFDNMEERVKDKDGFVLRNSAREREWKTTGEKAHFTVVELPRWQLKDDELLLMTIRSHDQFNTTVYDNDDRYRGVYNQRDVLFISPHDLNILGLRDGDRVDIKNTDCGRERVVRGFVARAFDLPNGCVAGYFPELNALVPLERRARESHTPSSKSVVVTVTRSLVPVAV